MSDKMREEFGEWLAAGNSSGCNHVAWKAWQASRAALVVELPEPHSTNGGDCVIDFDECRNSIHEAGVKTK